MTLGDRTVHYGTVTTLPSIADLDGRRRGYTLRDCTEMTIVTDYLESLDFATGTGCCTDVPGPVSDVHEQSCMMEHSPKPILITTHDEEGLKAIMDICVVHKGSIYQGTLCRLLHFTDIPTEVHGGFARQDDLGD